VSQPNPWLARPPLDQSAVAITGGNVPYVLSKSGIPFIGLSSGSVAAGGAISGITALPQIYSNAYCWFPANILAASNAAGWKFCQFTSTTAGTAFLDTYTSGTPTVPTSPTAVTAGQGAFTGDITTESGPTITVPAGALGVNGTARIMVYVACANNANVKTLTGKFSSAGGTSIFSAPVTSSVGGGFLFEMTNRGSAAEQITNAIATFNNASSGYTTRSTVDTSVATSLVIQLSRGTATDNLVLEQFGIEIMQ
jgi:hypothetical protein